MLKGIVSGVEKDIVRIPMKTRNLFDKNATNTANGYDDSGYLVSSGSITQSSSYFVSEYISVNSSAVYTLVYHTHQVTSPSVCFYDVNKNYISGEAYARTIPFTFTTPNNAAYIRFSGVDVSKDIIMLNAGSTALPYEPYGYQEGWEVRDSQDRLIWGREDELQTTTGTLPFKGYGLPVKVKSLLGNTVQNGTPTPDNIIMPEFVGVRTGNLFDGAYKNAILSAAGSSATYNTGSSGRVAVIPCNPSTRYTVKKHGDSNRFLIAESETSPSNGDTTSVIINNAGISEYTFTAAANTHYILVYVSTSSEQAEPNLMMNLGSTALPYEPYGWAEKITCAGQTVPVYLGQTQTVRRVRKLVLTGEETSWNEPSTGTHRLTLDGYMRENTNIPLCTHYIGKTPVSSASGVDDLTIAFLISASGNNYMYIRDPAYTSVTDFKSYLAAQYAAGTPVTVWYVLAEPQTAIVNEPLAKIGDYADELNDTVATLPEIQTTMGQNTLTVETEKIHGLTNPLCGIGDYKDVLNLSTGVIARKVKKLVLDGTENYSEGTSNYYIYINTSDRGIGVPNSTALSTHTESGVVVNNNGGALFFKKSVFVHSSLDDFKAFIAAQYAAGTPVTVWYVLATPETETVTVPYGLEGSVEGYLTQSGTPTPSSPITPDSNGILESGGTYAVEVSLVPSNLTVKGHIKQSS